MSDSRSSAPGSDRASSALTRRDALRVMTAGCLGAAATPSAARDSDGSFDALQSPMRVSGILIRNGKVVNADGSISADVRIVGERVVEVGPNLSRGSESREIDATGMIVIPGGIDPHTHLHPPFVDTLTTGTAAALAGGITTVGTFATPQQGEDALQALDRMERAIGREAMADVVLHTVTRPPFEHHLPMMSAIAERGQPSIKIFMLWRGFGAHLGGLIELLGAARDAGVVTLIHCEDEAILGAAARRLVAQGRTSLSHFAQSRPVISEVIATQQAAALCEVTGAPMQVVHLSSRRALEACRNQDTAGLPLYVEVRPLYLHLTEERLLGPDGPLFVGQPPLRSAEDAQALWKGIDEGLVDLLATDHAPWTRAQKLDPQLSITNLRPGVSDLRFMLPIYYSEGVAKGRISLERFVATTSTNAARILGLYPQKGVIQQGALADVVVLDPNRVAPARSHDDPSNSDYCAYEGWEVTGWPVITIRRGQVVFENGNVLGLPGTGQLDQREPWEAT